MTRKKYSSRGISDTEQPRFTLGVMENKPVWSFALLDFGGSWSFPNIDTASLRKVLERFRSLESMTWKEIESTTGSHVIEISSIIRSAQETLEELHLDDATDLFSLRIQGRERIWGIRDNHILRILWWDPNHEICPSEKRNT